MIFLVELDVIDDNPYQTRGMYDEEKIRELAEDIARMRPARPETLGLIQVPVGRLTGMRPAAADLVQVALATGQARVQLAAGHNRVRAFRLLRGGVPMAGEAINPAGASLVEAATARGERWAAMPVDVAELDDQAMADIAWSENEKRQDLTAIEEAEAIRRAMDKFGWTQTAIGERWGLSQPAVSNKLRLLRLPEDAQAAMRTGKITEHHGRILLQALSKTNEIYAATAALILPPAARSAEVIALATSLAEEKDFRRHHLGQDEKLGKERMCKACGGPAIDASTIVYYTVDEDGTTYLCPDCYRLAMGWEPLTTEKAESALGDAIWRESSRLSMADWPLDQAVGEGTPAVRQGMCDGCKARENRDKEEWCLDKGCFEAKKLLWFGSLVAELRDRLVRDFGDAGQTVPVDRDYNGHDLYANDATDQALVKEGICVPGKCARVKFRFVGDYRSQFQIRPYDDLPFVYACNKRVSHDACARRYMEGKLTGDQVEAAKLAKKSVEGRKKVGKALVERADLSVAKALRAGHAGAWLALARKLWPQGKLDNGQAAEASAGQVAKALLEGEGYMMWVDWTRDDADEEFEKRIRREMEKMGVGLLPTTDDLESRLERMSEFVGTLTPAPLPGGEWNGRNATPEMIAGNVENLTKIGVEAAEMRADGRMSEQNFEQVMAWVKEIREALAAVSQAAGISGEMKGE